MPTSFIAVQCFECSTMQVKQQKKSSNKWSCVVCNQKQSVRKIFAQSFMAKDVRKFVQSFNMSRQLAEENQSLSIHDPQIEEAPEIEQHKRKRNDWTEYIDDDREECRMKFVDESNCTQGDDEDDSPVIVTEMPKARATFMKPKLKESSKKPSLLNRKSSKNMEGDSKKDNSQNLKWNSFMAQIRENCREKQPTQAIKNAKCSNAGQKVSKWSSFITEEDDDHIDDHKSENRERRDDYLSLMDDERVEEDIHPDFL